MSKPTISSIAAIGKNRELGKGGNLIWRFSEDLKRFKSITCCHPVIMGRKTFESIGKALPNRSNIVVTRQKDFSAPMCQIAQSLEDAINKASNCVGSEEIFIIGGAEIYKQAMPFVEKLYLTIIDQEAEADAYFPDFSEFLLKKEFDLETQGTKLKFCEFERP